MKTTISNLEAVRREGRTQVDSQRANILDAAERLFLKNGLENTSMSEIAEEAGITRVSLYRYFPDRDPIAFEISVRMLRKIVEMASVGLSIKSLENIKKGMVRMIDLFYPLRENYRFLGMFDHLYGSSYPNDELASWYKEQMLALGWDWTSSEQIQNGFSPSQLAMISNATMSFLEKMALRGDLMSEEQNVSLQEELDSFKEMIIGYFDQITKR